MTQQIKFPGQPCLLPGQPGTAGPVSSDAGPAYKFAGGGPNRRAWNPAGLPGGRRRGGGERCHAFNLLDVRDTSQSDHRQVAMARQQFNLERGRLCDRIRGTHCNSFPVVKGGGTGDAGALHGPRVPSIDLAAQAKEGR